MAGISDSAFRQMCKNYGADVVYSEMASVNALHYASEKTLEMLKSEDVERPYVVQLFGNEPEYFEKAAKLVEKEIKPSGIDINFGCPVPKIAKQKAGAELSRDYELSREVVKATLDGTSLPVSIKIRSKVHEMDALSFLANINDLDVKTVMIHGRSLSQMHAGPVDAEIIKKARDCFGGIVLANGGVRDKKTFEELIDKSGADGVGIGQGALGRPWVFDLIKEGGIYEPKNQEEILEIALEHALLAEKYKGKQGVIEMRKHLCWYVQGLPGARKLREEFVKVESIEDIKTIIKKSQL